MEDGARTESPTGGGLAGWPDPRPGGQVALSQNRGGPRRSGRAEAREAFAGISCSGSFSCRRRFCWFTRWDAVETPPVPVVRVAALPPAPKRLPGEPSPIWQVEKTSEYEAYSNGLRIETRYATSTHHRRYVAFTTGSPGREPGALRDSPAGIVFHATESRQAPFEESKNRELKRLGESALDYVRRKGAYNFVIDRFGRVYRVVEEGDAANHAGYSLWADDRWIYINLNESFLGVSFEAGAAGGGQAVMSPAQQRAAAVLVEMLRSRYRIAAENCVTHAQVSVNPDNMRVGYHTDWAAGFPFEAIGLPNNYTRPLWAVAHFGFVCDPAFLEQADSHLRLGVRPPKICCG